MCAANPVSRIVHLAQKLAGSVITGSCFLHNNLYINGRRVESLMRGNRFYVPVSQTFGGMARMLLSHWHPCYDGRCVVDLLLLLVSGGSLQGILHLLYATYLYGFVR